ncbi:MAG: ATP-binding cassette domain-containing protein [Muribaculaceae bacterium]|nr:ATP-binding cassette domain-containing protein [Muribaculaceae bacterium]
MEDKTNTDISTDATPIIDYKGVDILRNEHVVLKDVTFNIMPGEMVYLVGRVGSGKSSLLKTLYGEVPVRTGEARIFDYDLRNLRRRDIPYLRRRIGIVFQDFQLLMDRTAYANLEFVLEATGWKDREAREERIDKVLKEVGMATKAHKMPHELSGGEQQRIVIARALLNEPTLILADEPTGNLDPTTSEQIMTHLYEVTRNTDTAVIMATHNMTMLDTFPGRTLRCDGKKLI